MLVPLHMLYVCAACLHMHALHALGSLSWVEVTCPLLKSNSNTQAGPSCPSHSILIYNEDQVYVRQLPWCSLVWPCVSGPGVSGPGAR